MKVYRKAEIEPIEEKKQTEKNSQKLKNDTCTYANW